MELQKNVIENEEEIFLVNVIEESHDSEDMLCNSLGCG